MYKYLHVFTMDATQSHAGGVGSTKSDNETQKKIRTGRETVSAVSPVFDTRRNHSQFTCLLKKYAIQKSLA